MSSNMSDVVSQNSPYDILVTGSSGFIGKKLLNKLTGSGYTVTAMSRSKYPDTENVKRVQADAFDVDSLVTATNGIETAFYLLHSMEGSKKEWAEFANREKQQAENFLKAATESGVKRIIYLGGLVNEGLELSKHMKSRHDVGKILASGNIPVTELRASVIVGAEGGSYAMLRYLVERLPLMVCPKWVKSQTQPIAVDNVVDYLIGAMKNSETTGKILEIGGPDIMTYEQLMRLYSSILNRNLNVIQIPFLTPRLSSYWIDLVTPVKASLARPLVDSLVHDSVVKDDSAQKLVPVQLAHMTQAIQIAREEAKITHFDDDAGYGSAIIVMLCRYLIEGKSWEEAKFLLANDKDLQESWNKVKNAKLSPDGYIFNVIHSALHFINENKSIEEVIKFSGKQNYCAIVFSVLQTLKNKNINSLKTDK